MIFKNAFTSASGKVKRRIIVLLRCSVMAAIKVKPSEIDKVKSPRCFIGVKYLLVECTNTTVLRCHILYLMITCTVVVGNWTRRKITVVLDSCPTHPSFSLH
jgi:hypothetical protein